MNTVFVIIDETHDGDIFIDVCSTEEKAKERCTMFAYGEKFTIKETTLDDFKLREDGLHLFHVTINNISSNKPNIFMCDDDNLENRNYIIGYDSISLHVQGSFSMNILAKDKDDALVKAKEIRNKFIKTDECKKKLNDALDCHRNFLNRLTDEEVKDCGLTRDFEEPVLIEIL